MKRAKRLYALLGILAAVCIVTVIVVKYEEKQEEIRNSDEIILEIDPDTVQSLSWEYESETLSFQKSEDTWLYEADEAFPVDEEKIHELLEVFQQFGAAFIIEEVTDYSQYGLDNPTCTINLATDEESYEIDLGSYSAMDSQRYVSIGDGNVYLVTTDPLDSYSATLSDMIKHDETPDFDTVERIEFTGDDTYQVVYQEYTEDSPYTYCEDDVYFKEDGDNLLPLDTSLVESYLHSISNLTLSDYVTYNVTDEELAQYGLDNPELTVSVQYTLEDEEASEETSQVFTMSISRDPEELQKAADEADSDREETGSEEEEEITAYARIGDSKIIYQITASSYTSLMSGTYDDLRHHEVLAVDFSHVTGMDISLDGASYAITSQGSGEDKTFYYNDEELAVDNLQSALEGISADSFTSDEPTQKEELSLTVYLDNEVHPQVQIAFYRYDGDVCLALIDGEPVSLVPRASVVDLIEAINAIVL